MEDDNRHLQPVKLDIIGSETGRERYVVDDWVVAPQIANWRNNLTACSQRHNLHFVAHQETVAVFQPSFPSHKLGRQPHLNILPSLAKANARGALDPSRPNSINHLIVGELGSEEILFLSTDSGNVAAYYTAAIQDGIEKEPYKFSREGRGDLVGIRPFFTHWVYESAWGLSIHKHARMLAVSSNRPCYQASIGVDAAITVFSFALTSSSGKSTPGSNDELTFTEEDESEWKFWVPNTANPTKMPDRSQNWKTRLEAHTCNIPSVSFVNSDDDREGNYLLSTDIKGITKCWHIWQSNVLFTWDFSSIGRTSNPYLNSQQTSSGWTVLALDPSSFQVVDTHEEFCGDSADNENFARYLDITRSLRLVPGHDRSLAGYSAVSASDSDNDEDDEDPLDQFDGNFSDDDSPDVTSPGISHELANTNSTRPESMDPQLYSNSNDFSQVEEGESSGAEIGDESTTSGLIRVDSRLIEDEDLSTDWPDFSMPGGYNSSELYGIQIGSGAVKKVKLHHPGTLPAFQQPLPKPKGPIIPTLHLSASHLRLFDAKRSEEASVYCSELLSFQWPMYYATHPAIDRLNLTQYIPELGIVVIGTQIGRVAVCSLTRKGSKGPFGVRVEWILPFESQEKDHERPFTQLLGIAAGPVQGHQLSRSSSVSEDDEDMERTWLQDRVDDDGVLITFDPNIVKMRRSSSGSTGECGPKKHCFDGPSRTKPRDRATAACSSKRRRTLPLIVNQAWPSRSEVTEASAVMDEPWRGLEYSRRYRLMVTYYDQTVLTYELSREKPFVGDPAMGRPNWRNREEFW